MRQYILFHNKQHPKDMGEREIEQFLTSLALDRNVAASTQNQAFNAILFLYRERVFQLEQKALEKCRDDEYLEHFENTIKIAVSEILKSGSEASAVSSNNKKELDCPSDKMLDMTKYNKFSFEIVRLENGSQPVLVIRSLKPVKESGLILVTEDEIESFYAGLVNKLESIGWKKRMKSKSIADIKQKYPRAYETWEIEEDEKLKNGFAKELSIEELSGILKRQPGAVKSRLEKIGLK